MANDKDNGKGGLPVNFERIGEGRLEKLPGIVERGSEGNPSGGQWRQFIKDKHGIDPPKEPESERDVPESEMPEKTATNQKQEPEKDEPEKD